MSAHVVELVVRGRLSPELLLALEGFRVETARRGLTRLVGAVADQARLIGILDLFDALHIEVISVNPAEPEMSPEDAEGETA